MRIGGRVVSHYDAVEAQRSQALAQYVADGLTVLVVSDAGMPLVSDRGWPRCGAASMPVCP